MDLFLNLLKYSQKFPNLYFVRYLSYSLLGIHRKLKSGYLLCDKEKDLTSRSSSEGTTGRVLMNQDT